MTPLRPQLVAIVPAHLALKSRGKRLCSLSWLEIGSCTSIAPPSCMSMHVTVIPSCKSKLSLHKLLSGSCCMRDEYILQSSLMQSLCCKPSIPLYPCPKHLCTCWILCAAALHQIMQAVKPHAVASSVAGMLQGCLRLCVLHRCLARKSHSCLSIMLRCRLIPPAGERGSP